MIRFPAPLKQPHALEGRLQSQLSVGRETGPGFPGQSVLRFLSSFPFLCSFNFYSRRRRRRIECRRENTAKMAGAIIENMSTKKLCIVGGILLIFQVVAFLVGGLIGKCSKSKLFPLLPRLSPTRASPLLCLDTCYCIPGSLL